MPATNIRIVTLVVASIALLSMVCVLTLSYCLIASIRMEAVLLTAFVGITTGLIGALTGVLVSTRPHGPEPDEAVSKPDGAGAKPE